MTITTCPKCGSFNVTTAGVCANCGWSQFAQVTVSSGVYKTIGEIELKVTGKALLDDYKRLLFENNSLTARIAELEAELGKDVDLTIVGLRKELLNAQSRIAELEMKIRHNALWQASEDAEERAHLEKLVPDLKKRIAELEGKIDQLTAHDATERQDDKWIPVSERLPEDGKPVWVCTIWNEQHSGFLIDGVWVGLFRDFREGEITHWMPLPEPSEVTE